LTCDKPEVGRARQNGDKSRFHSSARQENLRHQLLFIISLWHSPLKRVPCVERSLS
jgi:hypothetical protein